MKCNAVLPAYGCGVFFFLSGVSFGIPTPSNPDTLPGPAQETIRLPVPYDEPVFTPVIPSDPSLQLAKRKQNKRKQKNKQVIKTNPNVIKIGESKPNVIKIGESGASANKQLGAKGRKHLENLGTSNDLDPATLAYRAQLQFNRMPDQAGQEKYIKQLDVHLFMGGDINARDAAGQTYLHHAVLKDQEIIAKYVLDKKIDTTIVNEAGLTAEGLAKKMRLSKMVQLIRGK